MCITCPGADHTLTLRGMRLTDIRFKARRELRMAGKTTGYIVEVGGDKNNFKWVYPDDPEIGLTLVHIETVIITL